MIEYTLKDYIEDLKKELADVESNYKRIELDSTQTQTASYYIGRIVTLRNVIKSLEKETIKIEVKTLTPSNW